MFHTESQADNFTFYLSDAFKGMNNMKYPRYKKTRDFYLFFARGFVIVKPSNCVWKDHRDKIKVPDPVVKDLISNKL